jgi:uncharacterized protein
MCKILFPDGTSNSAYVIDYKKLYDKGIRGLLFDIDNTLVEHGADANRDSDRLIRNLKGMGFKICILSNNKEERVLRFLKNVSTEYIYKAHKPSKKPYSEAMEKLGTDVSSTVFIGDQLFTDILGAKRTGIRCILVKKIARHEEIQIVLKRILEKPVLVFYHLYRIKHPSEFFS